MLLQDQAVTWDLRLFGLWPWIVSLMVAVAVIGLALYMKLRRSRRKFTANTNSGK
jgi:CHASE1-domain containing sensor protein